MGDNYQVPPPSYSEVASAPGNLSERAAMYAVPQQESVGEIKYPTVNPTVPMAYGVQVVPVVRFSRIPVQCTCANCRSMIVTRTEQKNGALVWLLCVLLILFGCGLGCCFIPFCISDLQDIQHYCPNCGALIGEYRPL